MAPRVLAAPLRWRLGALARRNAPTPATPAGAPSPTGRARRAHVDILATGLATLGAAKNILNIVGQHLVVFHANPSPALYDPSFIMTFRLRRSGVDVVRTYRDDSARFDILAVD